MAITVLSVTVSPLVFFHHWTTTKVCRFA